MKINKKGVSLIVLSITIAVSLVLITTIILNLSNENTALDAEEVAFKTKVKSYLEQLDEYIGDKEFSNSGKYDSNSLSANKTSMSENGSKVVGANIMNVIINMKTEDTDKFVINNGKLEYIGTNTQENAWAEELGI